MNSDVGLKPKYFLVLTKSCRIGAQSLLILYSYVVDLVVSFQVVV